MHNLNFTYRILMRRSNSWVSVLNSDIRQYGTWTPGRLCTVLVGLQIWNMRQNYIVNYTHNCSRWWSCFKPLFSYHIILNNLCLIPTYINTECSVHVCAAVKKYHRRTRVGIEPMTCWLLDRRHTTRPPRMPDGYGWFDSHNSSRYCVDLSVKDLYVDSSIKD